MTKNKVDVAVVGLGYIGLPTAAFLADTGLEVLGVDINSTQVETVNKGVVPFVEPGFDKLLSKVVESGSLRASTELQPADVFIIAVPTPFTKDKTVDDTYVMAAGLSILNVIQGGNLVVLESTSPPGLTQKLAEFMVSNSTKFTLKPGKDNSLYFAHAPERVLPGKIMEEMVANDRIIGGTTDEASSRAKQLYARFSNGEIHITNAATAELAKLTENSFRDVNIAFANELSMICDTLDVDVWELIRLANRHPRVNILQPGPGVGGHCIAVDPWFIVSSAPNDSRLIKTAREVNDSKPQWVLTDVRECIAKESITSIAVLGIAFKPDIDDLRESPALAIAEKLAVEFPEVPLKVFEPNISQLPQTLAAMRSPILCEDLNEIDSNTLVVVLVDHSVFKDHLDIISQGKQVIDTRGLLS